jgi:hypothetical protein
MFRAKYPAFPHMWPNAVTNGAAVISETVASWDAVPRSRLCRTSLPLTLWIL